MKKISLLVIALLTIVISLPAFADVTEIAAAQGMKDEGGVTTTVDNGPSITIVAETGSGSVNPGWSKPQLRMNAGNTLTISILEGYVIEKVEMSFSSDTYTLNEETGSVDNGSFETSGTTSIWTLETPATSAVLTAIKALRLKNFKVTWSEVVAEGSLASPTISGPEGVFFDSAEVSIACATEGAEIYYTLNGEDPTVASSKYEAAFPISATTTVKAISVLGEDISKVVSKTFTAGVTVATAAELYASSPEVGTVYRISGPMTVVKQKSGNGNIFLLDADGVRGMRFYNSSKWTNVSYSEGQTLSNVVGSFGYTGNSPQLVVSDDQVTAYWPATAEGEEATVEPTVIAVDEVSDTDRLNSYVKVEKMTITNSGNYYYIGEDNAVQLYDVFGTGIVATLSDADLLKEWDVTGFAIIYNKQVEIAITALTENVTVNEEDPTPGDPIVSFNGETLEGVESEGEVAYAVETWPFEQITVYSQGANKIKVVKGSAEATYEEGNTYTYTHLDEASAELVVTPVYVKEDNTEYPSQKVAKISVTEKVPGEMEIKVDGKSVSADADIEAAIGAVVSVSVKGETGFTVNGAAITTEAVGEYGFAVSAMGTYVIEASNAAGVCRCELNFTEPKQRTFAQVFSVDELNENNSYVIVSLEQNVAMGQPNSKNGFDGVAVSFENYVETGADAKQILVTDATSGIMFFTLVADGDNWKFMQEGSDSGLYITSESSTNLDLKSEGSATPPSSISVTIDESGNATLENTYADDTTIKRHIMYRSGDSNNVFKYYSNSATSGYYAIQLFKEQEMITAVREIATPSENFTIVGSSINLPAGACIYNLAGSRVNAQNLQSGVYIIRFANGKATKVII